MARPADRVAVDAVRPDRVPRRIPRARARPDRPQGGRRGGRRPAGGRPRRPRCPDLMAALEASVAAVRGNGAPAARRKAAREGANSARESESQSRRRAAERVARDGPAAGAMRSGSPLVPCALLSVFAAPSGNTRSMHEMKPPQAAGLYHPENEHDACGVAFVAKLTGDADHGVVERALYALENLEHRGAAGADPTTGDGAGILLQLPDAFLRARRRLRAAAGRALRRRRLLPAARRRSAEHELEALIERTVARRGPARARLARRAGRRRARRRRSPAGRAPRIRQVFVGAGRRAGRPGRVRAQAVRDPPR